MQPVTIALTGHRSSKLYGYDLTDPRYLQLKEKLRSIIAQGVQAYGSLVCISGMALGADTLWAQVITESKLQYPGQITFIAAIPSQHQAGRWPQSSKDTWNQLMAQADRIWVSPSFDYIQALFERNRYMVDQAQVLIAIWDGVHKGGTAYTVQQAQKAGKRLIHIRP